MPNPLLDAALAYARRGWRVHPLKPRDKTPISARGCKDATLDEEQIRKWWAKFPEANIGLATGYDFFVIDVDPRHGGGDWLEAHDLPATHEAATGSGGKHLLYRMPDRPIHNSAGLIAPGVDVRGVGGYIVAAPSVHPSGTPYIWLDCDGDVPDGPCADAPLWIVDALIKLAPQPSTQAGQFQLPDRIPKGSQHMTLWRFACSLRSKTPATEEEIYAQVWEAAQRCEEIPPPQNVQKIVRDVCRSYQPGLSPEYAERHVRALMRQPVEPPAEELPPDDDGSAGARLSPNELAKKVLSEHRIINVDSYLYEYEENHWRQISPGHLKALAMRYDVRRWTSQKRRSEAAAYITDLTHRKIQAWRLLAPYELPTANGVIDIRSMSMRPHSPEDYLQACIPVPYDQRAQCPVWMRCLDTYFGKDDDADAKINALQEFFGYCLMPHARYKKALLCVGESDCGKSTIPFLLRLLVGDKNMCAVSVEDMDDPRARVPLMGKMVNALTELPSDAMIADGGFKTLVSTEEPIQFDPKYLPSTMEVPICKHVIVTNVLPTINDRSKGTFNRLLLLQFNHIIPKAEQDRTVWDQLRQEASGILSWALEGAARLYHGGGTFTEIGRAEMEEYIADQNPIMGFLAEECDRDEDWKCPLREIHTRFEKWYGKHITPQWIAKLLRSSGFEIGKNPVWFSGQRARPVYGLRLRGYDINSTEE